MKEFGWFNPGLGDHHDQIEPRSQNVLVTSVGFTDDPSQSISPDAQWRHLSSHGDPKAAPWEAVRLSVEHEGLSPDDAPAAKDSMKLTGAAQPFGRPQRLPGATRPHTVSTARPFLRRRRRTARPSAVAMRRRKPCVRFRLILVPVLRIFFLALW